MAILVFADHHEGKFPKSSLEAVSYAARLAKSTGTTCTAVTIGTLNGDGGLGNAGASKVLVAGNVTGHDSQQLTRLVLAASEKEGADVIVFSHDLAGKLIAPRVAARLGAGIVPGATALPDTSAGFVVRKNVFSGKAIADISIETPKKVITVTPNSVGLEVTGGTAAVEAFAPEVGAAGTRVREMKTESHDGEIPLPEADLVVSAGRGMKGPEHWGIVEELARELGAATACSRPVSDIGWRPHHEHVGQTGITIRPNLYIAIGISGAIQHLAGVNGSKTIVVVNKDPEAPFFKAADYGIVGDAFEVVPQLIEAAKKYNASK
ncbi:MAG: electron transfer flavoprotein subunit alpha/FixB family protein [Flavobacteriales bacterium]|jgi:electron transfer flavoprotein alpha subunit